MNQVAHLPAGKRERTKVQNSRAILSSAQEVFGDLGYEAATVRDIIRRTGLAAGTFYNYFRSKEEVFAALADDGTRRFGPILKAFRASSPTIESFIRQTMLAYFNFRADGHSSWLAQCPPGERAPRVQADTLEVAAVFAEVRSAIIEAIPAGRGPDADPDYMAAACTGVAREVGTRMLAHRPIDTAGAADFTVAMIVGGLRSVPERKR